MYRPDWYLKESEALKHMLLHDDRYADVEIQDFLNEHATQKWKDYRDKIEKEYNDNLKKGIIID